MDWRIWRWKTLLMLQIDARILILLIRFFATEMLMQSWKCHYWILVKMILDYGDLLEVGITLLKALTTLLWKNLLISKAWVRMGIGWWYRSLTFHLVSNCFCGGFVEIVYLQSVIWGLVVLNAWWCAPYAMYKWKSLPTHFFKQ